VRQNVRDVWIIVPVKAFGQAKQRLASVLSVGERAQLAESMLCDVLQQLTVLPRLAGIAVVTADASAAEIAGSFGARHILDRFETGVNDAVALGFEAVRSAQSPVAVIAADVPFATSDEIAEALSHLERHPVVLTPAETDGGTNLLALRRPDLIEPRFGENSFARHRECARRRKLSCGVFRAPGLSHDIDRVRDLKVPTDSGAPRVRALLGRLDIVARLQPASVQHQLA